MKRAETTSYESYKKTEIHRSRKKWGAFTFWNNIAYFDNIVQETIELVGAYPKSICCMGVRNGNEYFGFKAIKGFEKCEVYGVDICPAIEKVGSNCFCYDFAQLPREWGKKFDWVYSNSIDHAYDLKETLKEWHRVCKSYILLTMSFETEVDESDVYSFSILDVETIFESDLFEVLKVWDKKSNQPVFSVLLKVK